MMYDPVPDENIVQRVLLGEVDGFKELVERYQRYIFSIGMRFFKNDDDSYDFVQDVFIRTYSNLKFYKGRAPFRFWLMKIAYNHGINKVNSRKQDDGIPDDIAAVDELTPEQKHVKGEVKEILMKAVVGLPEKYQICLDFYFFLGLNYNQIHQITGFPVNTIKSNVLRAKMILRDTLKGTIAEEYHDV